MLQCWDYSSSALSHAVPVRRLCFGLIHTVRMKVRLPLFCVPFQYSPTTNRSWGIYKPCVTYRLSLSPFRTFQTLRKDKLSKPPSKKTVPSPESLTSPLFTHSQPISCRHQYTTRSDGMSLLLFSCKLHALLSSAVQEILIRFVHIKVCDPGQQNQS